MISNNTIAPAAFCMRRAFFISKFFVFNVKVYLTFGIYNFVRAKMRLGREVEARELAKRFHVTRQTICQDITVLSLHCDIYTERGQNGGIYLLEKRGPFVNRLVHLRFKYLNNFCLLYQRKSVLSFSPFFMILAPNRQRALP